MDRFGTKARLALLVFAVLAGMILFFAATRPTSAPGVDPLVNTFDDTPAFTFDYPEGWVVSNIFQGVLVAGLPESLDDSVPGPVFTVQRTLTSGITGDLSGAIAMYLEAGPQRQPGMFEITMPETDTTIDGRPGRVIELEGAEPGGIAMHSRVAAVEADNSFIYLFIMSLPRRQRDAYRATFDLILDSVRIFE